MAGRPRAAILVTGDEVLRGRVRDRNGGVLARSLDERGAAVERIVVVGDGLDALEGALAEVLRSGVDLVVTSGGLGPTHDDRTMEAVARATGRPLALDRRALDLVRAARAPLRRREVISSETRRAVEEKQASLPEGALVLPPAGTAPGCVLEHAGVTVCVLPGPPWELAAMWEAALGTPPLVRILAAAPGGGAALLRLHGVVESRVVEVLAGAPAEVRDAVEIGICARAAEIEISARGPDAAVAALEHLLEEAFGERLYARRGETALDIVAATLRERGERVAVAESCTGGLLGCRLTAPPGASEWFLGGVIAYANALKEGLLGVDPALLARHGAVSAECAGAMAGGVRSLTGADWAVSVTGIAGPGGGTPHKPVGVVYLGLADPSGGVGVEELLVRGDRERVREQAAASAVHLLRRALRRAAPVRSS